MFLFVFSYAVYADKKLDYSRINMQAKAESLINIRPGLPGKVPFWNDYAIRFIYAPSFDFPEVEGANYYRITVVSDANDKKNTFEAPVPYASLSPVWNDIPTGWAYVLVEGLNRVGGEVVGKSMIKQSKPLSTELTGKYPDARQFYKSACFSGPYNKPVRPLSQSAKWALEYQLSQPHYQSWKNGKPGVDYKFSCFTSKMISAVIRGMVYLSEIDKDKADEAMLVAKKAADYIIGISQSKGDYYEYMPPTYHLEPGQKAPFDWWKERAENVLMMQYPAYVGTAYLDLYDFTKDKKYLKAALNIAETYQKTQNKQGTWPLTVKLDTGENFRDMPCIPMQQMFFFDRLISDYGYSNYEPVLKKSFNWVYDNIFQNFKWSGQFEDSSSPHTYSNLTLVTPSRFALYLLEHSSENENYVAYAEELLRFCEDQFVIWEKPSYMWDNAYVPCAVEQYGCYNPFDGSMTCMVNPYMKAYEVTGDDIYLAKAKALVNTQTAVQSNETGQYLTAWYLDAYTNYWRKENWDNCATISAMTIIDYLDILE